MSGTPPWVSTPRISTPSPLGALLTLQRDEGTGRGRGSARHRFGEGSATRMASWVDKHFEDQHDAVMIDLGCGNGHLVFELVRRVHVAGPVGSS